MCKWGTTRKINVIRRANPFVKNGWHERNIDKCIADWIQELNCAGIITEQSCCGHGKTDYAECSIAEESVQKVKEWGYEPIKSIVGYKVYPKLKSVKNLPNNQKYTFWHIRLENNLIKPKKKEGG